MRASNWTRAAQYKARGRPRAAPDYVRIAVAMELEGVTPSIPHRQSPIGSDRYFQITEAGLVQKVQRWRQEYRKRTAATTG